MSNGKARQIAAELVRLADEIDRKSTAYAAQDAQVEADDYDLVLINKEAGGNCYRYRRGKATCEFNTSFPSGTWHATSYKREQWKGDRLYYHFASMAAALKWWNERHPAEKSVKTDTGDDKSLLARVKAEIGLVQSKIDASIDEQNALLHRREMLHGVENFAKNDPDMCEVIEELLKEK